MARQHYQRLSPADIDEIWRRLRSGHAVKAAARALRLSTSTVRVYLIRCGGIRPDPRRRGACRLSLEEREEISRGLAAGLSLRAIAAGLGRSASTISREVAGNGGRRRYRAATANQLAWVRATRPKVYKLAMNPVLAGIVTEKLQRGRVRRSV
jgi:DNA-binding CsgD family transcriptional regulator